MKKRANKQEREHMSQVAEIGCIVCELFFDAHGTPAELHHITKTSGFGARAKHTEVIPLCHMHHRTGGHGVAVHAGVNTWEEKFDTQQNLLKIVNERV